MFLNSIKEEKSVTIKFLLKLVYNLTLTSLHFFKRTFLYYVYIDINIVTFGILGSVQFTLFRILYLDWLTYSQGNLGGLCAPNAGFL